MGTVIVQDYTTKNPLSLIGEEGGICWNSDTTDVEKNKKRGIECIENDHGRVLEFPQIYLILKGYSARTFRELYTHIGGSPTRVQSSTRYVDGENFEYIIPPKIQANDFAAIAYKQAMENIRSTIGKLKSCGIPKEDYANLLPLGMTSEVVYRTNLRALKDMAKVRTCTRAYWEYRELMKDIKKALSEYSEEWKEIAEKYLVTKCDVLGYCNERYSCNRYPKK